MFKKILIISILLILSIGMVSASDNATDEVVSFDQSSDVEEVGLDENNNLQIEADEDDLEASEGDVDTLNAVSGKKFTDINDAIFNANDNAKITLSGTYTANDASDCIYPSKSITLQGSSSKNKAVLDASGLGEYVNIISTYQKITLKNIIFRNCKSIALDSGSDLTIQNCVFENNGGAIEISALEKVTISIKDTTFEANSALNYAAIDLYMPKQSTATISNCIFNNNKADNEAGAIYIRGNEVFTVNILNSTFNSNSASRYSAIYAYGGTGNIKNNVFINNKGSDDLDSIGTIYTEYVLDNNTVKSSTNVNENLKLEFLNDPTFYGEVCQVKFTKDGKPLSNKKILLLAHKRSSTSDYVKFSFVTDSNGIGKFAFASPDIYMDVGTWDFQFIADSGSSKLVISNNNLNVKKLSANLIMKDLTTNYASGKTYSVKLVNKDNNKVAAKIRLYVTIYKNGLYLKNYKITTDLNGMANVKISDLGVGNYKIEITSYEDSDVMNRFEKSAKLKINKAPTKVKAPKVKNKFKKSKYFKVTVKAYNKPVNKIKVKVKVYTGKKSKTYKIKTNKKGVAKLNTKKLAKGKHKVVISSGNGNYKISAKSKITIK